MLKILNTQQIKELDARTILGEPIESIDLMERACKAFIAWFTPQFDPANKIGVVCGTGNNGGDGLGIARILSDLSYHVRVWIVRGEVKESVDFATNLKRLPGKIELREISHGVDIGLFQSCNVLIDAIFGSGLSRPPQGIHAQVIERFNQADAVKIAVDIPSGLLADAYSSGSVVQADHTVSFQLPKLAFMLPENEARVGEWQTVGIGLDKKYLYEIETKYYYLTHRSVRKRLRKSGKFSHKGDFGKVLLIAGSHGKMGACVLAARAAMRSGAGLLTAHVPKCGYSIIQTTVPEAMASVDSNEEYFSTCPDLGPFSAIGIGPGIGTRKETVSAFRKILEFGKPLVLDADALNILATSHELLRLVPADSIFTPHPGEFERLVGEWRHDFERLDRQVRLAGETKSIVILKGAHTSIALPDGTVFFNSTGNPGMATGGSGDVLTGILAGLLAQGYSSADTAILGVHLHGLAGDLAAEEKGTRSLIASDIIDFLPKSFQR